MKLLFKGVLVLGLYSALSGCGGDDGGDNLGGVDGDKTIGELSLDEAEAICGDVRDMVLDVMTIEKICTIAGAAYRDTESACNDVRQACIDDPPSELEDLQNNVAEENCLEGEDYSTCSATVAEATACFKEVSNRLDAWLGDVSCANADEIGQDFFDDSPGTPEECEPLEECGLLD